MAIPSPRPLALRPWLLAGVVGALLTAAVDTILLRAALPTGTATGAGYMPMAWALHALLAVVFATGAALFASAVPPIALRPPAFFVIACALLAATLAVVLRADAALGNLKQEFPALLEHLRAGVMLGGTSLVIVGTCVAAAHTSGLPAAVQRALRAPWLCAAFFGACAAYAMWLGYFVIEPLHLSMLGGATTAAAVIGFTLASRAVLPPVHRTVARGAWLPVLVLWLLLPFAGWPWSDSASRFLLANHSPAAGWTAARLRDLTDTDGDGSAPRWMLGADCAPSNGAMGPLRTDVPGDGIDQDCSGADAPPLPAAKPAKDPARWCDPPAGQFSVLIVTVDAMRADALSPEVTPAMWAFSQQATRFTHAYAGASFTYHSMFVMSSGLPVSDLRNDITGTPNAKGAHIAGLLSRFGYATAAFRPVSLPGGLLTGFQTIWNAPGLDKAKALEHEAPQVTAAAVDWLTNSRNPAFAWLHYADAHAPYDATPKTPTANALPSPYLAELRFVDQNFARLMADLEARGLLDRTAIVLTADHGEDIGRRGHEGHGVDAYEDTVHVPMALRIPGCAPHTIDAPTSHNRIAATLIRLAGYEPGRPTLLSTAPAATVVSEVFADELLADEHRYKRALISGQDKLIHDVRNNTFALFDLAKDPGETRNLYDTDTARRTRLLAEYQTWLDTHGR